MYIIFNTFNASYNALEIISELIDYTHITSYSFSCLENIESQNMYINDLSAVDDSKNWQIILEVSNTSHIDSVLNHIRHLFKEQNIEAKKPTIKKTLAYSITNESRDITYINNINIYNDAKLYYNYTKQIHQQQIPIYIPLRESFGSGLHETTQSCIYLLQKILYKNNLSNILDIGTGTGILSIVAEKINTHNKVESNIHATDIDPISIKNTNENITLNKVHNVNAYISNGFNTIPSQIFDIIIANIFMKDILNLMKDSLIYTKKNSYIILSGLLQSQKQQILTFYNANYDYITEKTINNWTTLLLKRK